MSKLALELIEKEKRERTGKLDLSDDYSIDTLPLHFEKMIWLKELTISKSYSNIEVVKHLTNLEKLDLSLCRISNIDFLKGLKKLTHLDLWNTQVKDGNILTNFTKLTFLGLGNTPILDLSFLEKLQKLEKLYINGAKRQKIDCLSKLSNLRFLDCHYSGISDISFLLDLQDLEYLNIRANQIVDYTPISNLPKLQTLIAIRTFPNSLKFIENCKYLKELDLQANNISEVHSLFFCKSLEIIDLTSNNVSSINSIKSLKNIKELYLGNNQLKRIKQFTNAHLLEKLKINNNSIKKLHFLRPCINLKVLNCSNNPIKNIEPLSNLQILEELVLSDTKIVDYSPLTNLTKLKALHLSRNSITDLTFFKHLKSVKKLYISQTNIQDFQFLNSMDSLEYIDLTNSNIKDLTPFLQLLEIGKMNVNIGDNSHNINGINLKNNPIVEPPLKIVKQGNQAILNYFKELEKGDQPNHRIKMIIVGNGRVGKTSLLKRLQNQPYDAYENYTHGIQIGQLQKENLPRSKTDELTLKVWDFGGQEIFYATHQFFLSEEALYLLAWTDEANVKPYGERDKATLPPNEKWRSREYWLENIRLRSTESPIVMVQTHSDMPQIAINESDYAKAPYQATCLSFSAKKDYGLAELKDTITQKINNELPLYGKPFPITYNNVIEEIERLKNEENINYISYQYFVDTICRDANISEGGEATLCAYLNNTGVVVHYPNNPQLKDKVYINPNWLTQQVYCLINNQLIALKGKFDMAYLEEYLPNYQETGLVELLKAFELIFEAEEDGKTIYIAPQYLPKTYKSKELNIQKKRSQLAFVFRFPKFMPDNVMVNFISRYGSFAEDIYWKNGIYFGKYDTGCIVEQKDNQLFVYMDKGGNSQLLQREICLAFVKLSHHANAHISLDGEVFVDFSRFKKHYQDKYREITSVCGKKLEMKNYSHFFELSNTPEETNFGEKTINSESKNIIIVNIQNLNNYGSNTQFATTIINNNTSPLTQTDAKLLNLIHDNTSSDEERAELVKQLETVKTPEAPIEEKKKSASLLKKFAESFAVEGGKKMVQELIELGDLINPYL
jgi:internalin A